MYPQAALLEKRSAHFKYVSSEVLLEILVTTVDLIESQVEGLSDNFRCYRYQSNGIRIFLVWKCCTSCLGNCMLNDKVMCLTSRVPLVFFWCVWGHKGWRTARPTRRLRRCVPRKSTDWGQAFNYGWRVWKPACRCVNGKNPDSNIWKSHIVQGWLAWLEMNFIMILSFLYSQWLIQYRFQFSSASFFHETIKHHQKSPEKTLFVKEIPPEISCPSSAPPPWRRKRPSPTSWSKTADPPCSTLAAVVWATQTPRPPPFFRLRLLPSEPRSGEREVVGGRRPWRKPWRSTASSPWSTSAVIE